MNLMFSLMISTFISSLLVTIAFWLPQHNIYSEKSTPYECGFDPMGSARLNFV